MVLVDLIPLLVAFCVFVVCWCLLQAYTSTFGALLSWLAAKSASVTVPYTSFHPFKWLGDALKEVNGFINNSLAAAVQGTEHAWGKVLHAHAVLWHDLTAAVADLAEVTERQFSHLTRHSIQALFNAFFNPYGTLLHYLKTVVNTLVHAPTKILHTVTNTITHETVKVVTKVERVVVVKTKAAAVAIPQAIGIPLPRVGALERDVSALDKWVRGHGRLLTEAGIAGIVAAALTRLGLSSARCSRTQKWNKAVCGMNDDLLEALLAGTLVLGSTISIVEFAKYCQGFTNEVEGPLHDFVRELRDLNPVKAPNATRALANYAAGRY